ncbi:hypothetical protein WCN79_14585 [Xanthomonas axonopodis pv. vasculorum]|uniref:Uncharacterized protein n=1 Tax=Xanthomonas axonopodis pv. vasculorum TaxID=325777 RepID=A0A098Q183_9XANT|nr:hypothetical protein [Xanthomonas axonopodis]KGE52736.1 hypothetical protein GW15_0207305 [Xanthomonas axonopodis pv. vasculorum]PPV08803.1 hypothetical protein XavaCFBP5823_17195 [Xanthomonas axonopodis pv. vasculorum]QKD86464.1 hypothetical protein XAV_08690 [Xanthomonas axonopodis pv. vasculorum]
MSSLQGVLAVALLLVLWAILAMPLLWHAIALLDRRYCLHILQGPPMLHELLLWNAGSMALTFVIRYLWIRRTLRVPRPEAFDQ